MTTPTDYTGLSAIVGDALDQLDANTDFGTARDDDPQWPGHLESAAVLGLMDLRDALTALGNGLTPDAGPAAPAHLYAQSGERTLHYRLGPNGLPAEDIPAGTWWYSWPLRPESVRALYRTGDGQPWELYRVEITARRIRKDGTVNPSARTFDVYSYVGDDYYEAHAAPWLRSFVDSHRVPPELAPSR